MACLIFFPLIYQKYAQVQTRDSRELCTLADIDQDAEKRKRDNPEGDNHANETDTVQYCEDGLLDDEGRFYADDDSCDECRFYSDIVTVEAGPDKYDDLVDNTIRQTKQKKTKIQSARYSMPIDNTFMGFKKRRKSQTRPCEIVDFDKCGFHSYEDMDVDYICQFGMFFLKNKVNLTYTYSSDVNINCIDEECKSGKSKYGIANDNGSNLLCDSFNMSDTESSYDELKSEACHYFDSDSDVWNSDGAFSGDNDSEIDVYSLSSDDANSNVTDYVESNNDDDQFSYSDRSYSEEALLEEYFEFLEYCKLQNPDCNEMPCDDSDEDYYDYYVYDVFDDYDDYKHYHESYGGANSNVTDHMYVESDQDDDDYVESNQDDDEYVESNQGTDQFSDSDSSESEEALSCRIY